MRSSVGSVAQDTPGTAFSDLWWNPAESGWGMTVDHQGNSMFLTYFIQKADGSRYLVTGQLTRTTPGNAITTPVSFAGDVYETRGTYYGQPWNPSLVANRKVGTATFLATSLNAATVTYSIDGVNVQRQLERQTLQLVSFQGSYYGRIYYVTSNCNPATLNNDFTDAKGTLTITQNGSNIGMLFQGTGGCQFAGTYGQSGQLGNVSGTLACTGGGGQTSQEPLRCRRCSGPFTA